MHCDDPFTNLDSITDGLVDVIRDEGELAWNQIKQGGAHHG